MAKDIPAKTRKEVRERDNDTCQYCGRQGSHLHHIIFRSQASKLWVHDPRNLVTLCHHCHELAHSFRKWRKWWEEWQENNFGLEWRKAS